MFPRKKHLSKKYSETPEDLNLREEEIDRVINWVRHYDNLDLTYSKGNRAYLKKSPRTQEGL
jgi:hypothetical protein